MLCAKTLECGGPAPLWPVSPWTHLRIKLSCCEAISRPVDRGKVGQSASGLDRTRTVCFAQIFGVRRPGAAFACFSLDSFANQAVLLRSDFPSGGRGGRWAKRGAGSIAREPYASPKTLECGGPAPLLPVSPWTHLRIKLSYCEAISRPVDAAEGGPKRERARSHENRMLRPKLWSAATRRRFGLFLPGLICESSCLAAKRFPVRLTAARWGKARAGSIARDPYASPKTLECGGPAPLWPVSPWTHLRIKLSCCEAISRPVDRGKVGQSTSGLDRTRTVCFAQNFGVWRPGAALACFSLDSFANQAVLLRSDFPSVDRGVRWAKARAGSIAREPYASPKTLECGGPAPLWPVSPWTHLRSKLSCCEAVSRPVDRGKVGQSASGLDRTRTVCFAQNFGVRRPGAALACFSLDSFANQAVLLRGDFPSG